jgi:hypothetical protein
MSCSLSTPGKDRIPIVREVGWAPGTVWTGAENLAPTGIRSPDRPARSHLLYWLSYPANDNHVKAIKSLHVHFLEGTVIIIWWYGHESLYKSSQTYSVLPVLCMWLSYGLYSGLKLIIAWYWEAERQLSEIWPCTATGGFSAEKG